MPAERHRSSRLGGVIVAVLLLDLAVYLRHVMFQPRLGTTGQYPINRRNFAR